MGSGRRLDRVARRVSPTSPFAALQHRNFTRFLVGNTITNVGQFLQGLSVPFLVNEMTDANRWVGAVSFAALIPAVMTTPISGTLADRINRRTILAAAYAVQTAVTTVFLVLYLGEALTPWRILGLQLVSGAAAGFQWAPTQSLTAILVPRSSLQNAVRLVSISFTAGPSICPMVAALILALSGPGLAFAGTVGCYVVGVLTLLTVRSPWTPPASSEGFVAQFRAGVTYVRRRPSIRLAIRLSFSVAALMAVFAFALTASVADDVLHTGGGGLGALAMMMGLGSVLSSIYISGRGGQARRSRLEAFAVCAYAVGMVVAASTPWLIVGLVGFLIMGVAHMLHGVNLSTALQLQIDEAYRGRVMAVWLFSMLSGIPLGSILGGILGDLIGVRIVMFAYTALFVLLVAVTARTTGGRPGLGLLDADLEDGADA